MHGGNWDQIGALVLVELVEIRLVLEEVGIDLLLSDLHVRLYVIGEDLDVEHDPVLGQRWLDMFKNLGMRHRRRGHAQMGFGLRTEGERRQQAGKKVTVKTMFVLHGNHPW